MSKAWSPSLRAYPVRGIRRVVAAAVASGVLVLLAVVAPMPAGADSAGRNEAIGTTKSFSRRR